MRLEQKTSIQNSIGRLVLSALSCLLQIMWLLFLGIKLKQYSTIVGTITSVLALVLVLWVYDRRDLNSNFKMPWMIFILVFPVLGICLFVLFGHKYSKKVRRQMEDLHKKCISHLSEEAVSNEEIEKLDPGIANQFRYLVSNEDFPLYSDTEVKFYSEAIDGYEDIIEAAKNATKYIYMEYFAIQPKSAFSRLEKVLLQKLDEGVEVRLMYDDVGSIGFLNSRFAKQMQAKGIKCKAFNRVSPAFRLYMNNRDHRKITIIDGKVAFTGGFNIADEYFNITHPYGWWKDTGVRLTGPAVDSLLCMFLETWNSSENEVEDLERYKTNVRTSTFSGGYVIPYADSPLDESRVGENVYMNLIGNAKKTLYMTTPYLIISDEMKRALQLASLRGVDVRIVTPGIPDKKVIYRLTRSYYRELVSAGIKIYEFTPGFVHCKQFVADDEIAIVGTINLDYRSLFLHFENGVLMYQVDAVNDVAKDMYDLFAKSELVNDKYKNKQVLPKRLLNCFLRILAPLL